MKKGTTIYINEAGMYKLISCSIAPCPEAFSDYVTSVVLPAIRKNGYKIADKDAYEQVYTNPRSENALRYRVVDHINETYPDVIIITGLGENQTTSYMGVDNKRKGYQARQPDLILTSKTAS